MARNPVEFVTRLYWPDNNAAEVEVSPQTEDPNLRDLFYRGIRVTSFSQLRVTSFSQHFARCLPLQVLHTIGSAGLYFKLRVSPGQLHGNIRDVSWFYRSCLKEAKTAVVKFKGGNEIHLVAMGCGSVRQVPCFWAYLLPQGLYATCLHMIHRRSLAIVFDLDETLVVANTQTDFERKMHTLRCQNPKTAESAAELKRYQDDMAILEQFIRHDRVIVNGRAIESQKEVVPPVSEGAVPIIRPIIRLPERNMILTRIYPDKNYTSVLVKLRPGWDNFRSYIIEKGRKRFEAYICTMSERDYALEMWRLLDPQGQLIDVMDLNDRLVCVEPGGKKSLANVFARQIRPHKMAMVIDDRLDVWDAKDQCRVLDVTPFAPYGAPQPEIVAGPSTDVLNIAKMVASIAREEFFRHFEGSFHRQMKVVCYDSDLASLPSPPDVSDCLRAGVNGRGRRDGT